MILTRRKLLSGAVLLFAAPAIVRASSLMQVKNLFTTPRPAIVEGYKIGRWENVRWIDQYGDIVILGDISIVQ